MKIFKRLIIICILILVFTNYFNLSLLKLHSEAIIDNIASIRKVSLYNNSISNLLEIQKIKSLDNLNIKIKSSIINLIESFNKYILKDSIYQQATNTTNDGELIVLDIMIGDAVQKVLDTFGEPARKDFSQYGFKWYIYNQDYSRYLQVGIFEGKVVGIYTNSKRWENQNGVGIGSSKEKVISIYGEPLSYFKKGNILYYLNNLEESHTYLINNYYATFFFDLHNDNKVTAIQIIDKDIEEKLEGFYGTSSEELRISFEKQIFDLANAARATFGLPPFQWDDKAALAARKQSMDMAKRNFFSHENPDGQGPSDRLEQEGILWRKSGENIAAGQASAIFAHENWMNSIGHRQNILGDYKKLGVGVYFGGEYNTYYTQKFYTPR